MGPPTRPPPLPPAEQPPPNSPSSPPVLSHSDTKLDTAMVPSSLSPPKVDTERNDSQWDIGECISYDNVGPISPESIEGYRQFIAFHDTQSRPATRTPFSTTYSGFYASSPAEVSNRAFSAVITTQPSAQLRPINFMRTTSATTKAPHLTNNGKTQWSETYKLSYPTSLQSYMAKTLCAPISGPTP